MKIIFAGGGTGGHLYPSLAVAEELRNKNADILFLVSNRGIDSRILMKSGFPFIEQDVSAFMGKGLRGKLTAVIKLVKGVFKVFSLIHRGDKVFITGGFASAPAAMVAKIKRCDLYLHEQNSVMGLVNRIFAGFSKKVFLSFEDTKGTKGNTVITGNPVRRVFREIKQKEGWDGRILVMGGSQGSRKINKLVASSIDFLIKEGFSVIHQTGEGLYRETMNMYGDSSKRYATKLNVCAYIDKPAGFVATSDIVVCRSGSGTIFELLASGVPALYIPFKAAAENHQYFNAKAIEDLGGAMILKEDDATVDKFMAMVTFMRENIEDFRDKIRSNPPRDSVKLILSEMEIS